MPHVVYCDKNSLRVTIEEAERVISQIEFAVPPIPVAVLIPVSVEWGNL